MSTPRGAPAGVVLALALSIAPHGALAGQESAPRLVAISDVSVVEVAAGRILEARTVVLAEGRIRSVEPGGNVPAGAERIDGTGRYLIPGLIDAHAHLRHPLAPTLLLPQFVAHGVTGVRDMASDCEEPGDAAVCAGDLREWSRRVETGELAGPRVLALSSFPLNPPWGFEPSEGEVAAVVDRLAARDLDWIKVYYRMSPDLLRAVIREADRHGLRVGGHLPLRMTASEAAKAGLGSLEHARDFLFDCFPGSAEWRAEATSQNPPMEVMRAMVEEHDPQACEQTFRTLVESGTWYVPTHVTRRMDAYADDPAFRADARQKYIPADVWEGWQEDADRMVALDPSPEGRATMRGFYEEGLAITGRAHAAGVKIALGTDAGDTYVFPGSGAHDELGELVKAGLTPAEALAAATIRGAELLGLAGEYGTVEPGKRADLVLLAANPLEEIDAVREIEVVILGGRIFTREHLDAMLAEVERRVRGSSGGPAAHEPR